MKRLGDIPAESWDMIRAVRDGQHPQNVKKLLHKKKKTYEEFGEFLMGFITDLNHLSEEGWSILVEGKRDARALVKLGCVGNVVTVSSMGRRGNAKLEGGMKIVILTDLDREGAVLAAKYVRRLSHDGFKTSLRERMRLKNASHGVFLHVENLSRFARDAE